MVTAVTDEPWRGVLAGHGARASRSFFFDYCATHVNKLVDHTVKKGNSCALAQHRPPPPPCNIHMSQKHSTLLVARVIITPRRASAAAAPAAAAALS
jgi:hypothetical protein